MAPAQRRVRRLSTALRGSLAPPTRPQDPEAILAAIALFVVWLPSPEDGRTFVATATGKSIAAMALGGLVFSVLARMIAHGVKLPQELKYRLPLLERRLNGFVPKLLTVLSFVVVFVVVTYIMDTWALSDFRSWFASAIGQRFAASLISQSADAHQRFFDRIDAPFVGNGFTRWVDGQYALDRPELGLSNWEFGRLFARGGVLSGDSVFTVRSRATQTDPNVGR